MMNYKYENPEPLHSEGIEERIVKLLPKNTLKLKVLDAAAGQGYFSKKLSELGYDVYPIDKDPINFKVDELNCIRSDLNDSLPYDDAFFDIVLSVETIEHLENTYLFINEIYRVLKPGGLLIITTPNVTNIFSRIKFLINGRFWMFGKHIFESGYHISPITWWMLEGMLRKANFEIKAMTTSKGWVPVFKKYFETDNLLLGHILIISAIKVS